MFKITQKNNMYHVVGKNYSALFNNQKEAEQVVKNENNKILKKRADSHKNELIEALDMHVQQQIDAYNTAQSTVFENVQSCALYATQAKERPHDPFCKWVWEWKDDVFDYAGAELIKIQKGQRAMPSTTQELLLEIETKYPAQTQTFIGANT